MKVGLERLHLHSCGGHHDGSLLVLLYIYDYTLGTWPVDNQSNSCIPYLFKVHGVPLAYLLASVREHSYRSYVALKPNIKPHLYHIQE